MLERHDHREHSHDEIGEVALDDVQALNRERALGGVSARAKVIALGVAILANMVAPSALTPSLIFVVAVILLVRAGVPRGTIVKRLMVPWYFAFVVFVTQLLFFGKTELFTLGPAVAYAEGLARGVVIGSKVIGGTAAVLVVSMTTPMTGLLAAAAWLRVPKLLVEIAALTYRYLFLLAEEADRIREAQKTRLGHSSWWTAIRSYSTLGGMVIVSSYDRAERVYHSMVLRGYSGSMPVPEEEAGFRRADVVAVVATVVALGAALLVDVLLV